MSAFIGTWTDQDGATITVEQSNGSATAYSLKYSNGRGPFTGFSVDLGSTVVSVDFSDGSVPAAGDQAGVINFDGNTINWSNQTVWKKS
ncbi:MAG: hypothetical protein R8G66_21135 [Cytophagales bacterium]|nr:hypothetical protein [Cytophagales bacterium]